MKFYICFIQGQLCRHVQIFKYVIIITTWEFRKAKIGRDPYLNMFALSLVNIGSFNIDTGNMRLLSQPLVYIPEIFKQVLNYLSFTMF